MKLGIFGATGPLGLQLVQQAIDKGHHVRAIVRNPAKLSSIGLNENFEVLETNIMDEDEVESALEGCDAVVSALGARPSLFQINLMTDFSKVLVNVMRKIGLNRFVVCTANCTTKSSDHPWFVEWILKPVFLGRNMDDFHRMEEYLEKECADDINYTVVKPPHLTNAALEDDGKCNATEGQFVTGGKSIPRANVAHFMLACLENDTWDRKLVAIAM